MLNHLLESQHRFQTCHRPVRGISKRILSSIKMEMGSGEPIPKVMLVPSKLHRSDFSIKRIQTDVKKLDNLIEKNPKGLKKLIDSMNNRKIFIKQAKKLGLSELDFVKEGGGWLLLVIVAVAAIALTGCPDEGSSSRPPPGVTQCSPSITPMPGSLDGGGISNDDFSRAIRFQGVSSLGHTEGDVIIDKVERVGTPFNSPFPSSRHTLIPGDSETYARVEFNWPWSASGSTSSVCAKIFVSYICPDCNARTSTNFTYQITR